MWQNGPQEMWAVRLSSTNAAVKAHRSAAPTFVYAAFKTISELRAPRLNWFPSLLLRQQAGGLDWFWSMWILVLSQLQVAEALFCSREAVVCILCLTGSVIVKRISVCCLLSFDAVEGAVTAVIRCSKEKHSPPNPLWQV